MQKQYTFIANWKMNMSFSQTLEFATRYYDNFLQLATETNQHIILCPSTEALFPLAEMFKETQIAIGAQNCSKHSPGPFTGQTSAVSIQEVGCQYAIIGHHECRKEFGETNNDITNKAIHLLDYDITPIVCIGETKDDHTKNKTLQVLEEQLSGLFKALCGSTVHSYLTPYIAYEPVWSIGTGKVAPVDHLEMVFCWLADYIKHHCANISWKLIYGGSVSLENPDKLKQIVPLSGFLMGKSSLDFQKIEKIVKSG